VSVIQRVLPAKLEAKPSRALEVLELLESALPLPEGRKSNLDAPIVAT
jgi:hypothetical protein